MKKVISLLLVVFLTLGTTNLAFASTNRVDSEIKHVISNYISSQFDSLKNDSEESFIKAKDYFNFNSDVSMSIFDYELGRLKYTIYTNKATECDIKDYKLNIDYLNINFEGNKAIVDVNINYTIIDNFTPEGYQTSNQHKLTLHTYDGKWLIENDIYSDEFKDLHPIGTNFDTLISEVSKNIVKNDFVGSINIESNIQNNLIEPNSIGDYYSYYNRQAAVNYALKWTSEGTVFDGTSYNNNQFKYFSYKQDCQNYVSQCIWAGFGGTNSANKDYPMNSVYWWANTTSYTSTGNWLSSSYFLNYSTDNYNNNYHYRVQCQAYNFFDSQGNFILSNTEVGDYIYVPGHVMLITGLNDTNYNGRIDYSEIKFSAHTYNHLNHPLYISYPVNDYKFSGMKLVKPIRIRRNDSIQPY